MLPFIRLLAIGIILLSPLQTKAADPCPPLLARVTDLNSKISAISARIRFLGEQVDILKKKAANKAMEIVTAKTKQMAEVGEAMSKNAAHESVDALIKSWDEKTRILQIDHQLIIESGQAPAQEGLRLTKDLQALQASLKEAEFAYYSCRRASTVSYGGRAHCRITGATGTSSRTPTAAEARTLAIADCVRRGGIYDCCILDVRTFIEAEAK